MIVENCLPLMFELRPANLNHSCVCAELRCLRIRHYIGHLMDTSGGRNCRGLLAKIVAWLIISMVSLASKGYGKLRIVLDEC
ncbi:MAG: hypothetical protein MUO43_03570, partial [Desulfobacterales bacterium]|nr:hypothetical protein [Desulfobacterales bacterium]